ncbi:hypothetical protein AURDEDRAFT_152741 [Auricularia subglabra TFB-10046 SS5]|nr:hypothetical protein AURDEDRAFT_152741 [Auricularia subglabra TFB-10046 SS5]
MSQPAQFNAEGRVICWTCSQPAISLVSGTAATAGKRFYKCHLKTQPQCPRFFRWQDEIDSLRILQGVPDPDAAPATPAQDTAAASAPPTTMPQSVPATPSAAPSSSQPIQPAQPAPPAQPQVPASSQPSSSQPSASGSQPTPGRGRAPRQIDYSAPPQVTPQKHLSRKNTAEATAAVAPTPVTPTPHRSAAPTPAPRAPQPAPAFAPTPTPPIAPAPSPSPAPAPAPEPVSDPEPESDHEPAGLETVATDDEYERIEERRTPTRAPIYPTLPASQRGSRRERMPGTFASSSSSSRSTPTVVRVDEWRFGLPGASMPEHRADIFSAASPPPTQDTPPGAPASISTGARLHGLEPSHSPTPSSGVIRLPEPDIPVRRDVLRLSETMINIGRELSAAERTIEQLRAENRELLAERIAQQERFQRIQRQHRDEIQELEEQLAAALKRNASLDNERRPRRRPA